MPSYLCGGMLQNEKERKKEETIKPQGDCESIANISPHDLHTCLIEAQPENKKKSNKIDNQKKILPCSTYLSGEYGYEDIFIGVPIIIGKDGVEKIIELQFDKDEAENFKKSAQAVSELTQKCKKILE